MYLNYRQRWCGGHASVGVNENETTLLLSANYCHIRVRSTEAELIYAKTVDMRAKLCVRMNIL